MPKYCTADQCFNCSGQMSVDNRKLSFYKFPLHNKERLQHWLINMSWEKMVPTKHQHLCSEHFTPSCFEWRWGVRYLKPDAVPTIFRHNGNSVKKKNILRSGSRKRIFMFGQSTDSTPPAPNALLVHSLSEVKEIKMLETFAFAIDPDYASVPVYIKATQTSKDCEAHTVIPSEAGTVNLVPFVQIVKPYKGVTNVLNLTDDNMESSDSVIAEIVAEKPLCFEELSHKARPSSLVGAFKDFDSLSESFECTAPTERTEGSTSFILKEAPSTYDNDELNWQGALIIENVSIDPLTEEEASSFNSDQMLPTKLGASAKAVSPGQTGAVTLVTVLPETVLPPGITAPIVCAAPNKPSHVSASGLKLCDGPKGSACLKESQWEIVEGQFKKHVQLTNNVTNDQLLSIAVNLQKKVKVLQQRHRRHRAKIETMEGIVEQLRKENVISEEKLKMLEKACSQSNTEVTERAGTVAILCPEEDNTILYTIPEHTPEEKQLCE